MRVYFPQRNWVGMVVVAHSTRMKWTFSVVMNEENPFQLSALYFPLLIEELYDFHPKLATASRKPCSKIEK